jgi:hypothetical protein
MTIVKSPMLVAAVLAGSVAGMLSTAADAQNAPIEFRLIAAQGNPTGCMSLDASLSRVHTVTLMGDKATIKSAGGIDDTMKLTAPNVYKTTFSLGGVRLDVVADASKTPRTLDVTEAARGCRWNATAP